MSARRKKNRFRGKTCAVCGTHEDLMGHHTFSQLVNKRHITVMCRTCESAVHNRIDPRPGTEEAVLHYRAFLPAYCIHVRTEEGTARRGPRADPEEVARLREVHHNRLQAWLAQRRALLALRRAEQQAQVEAVREAQEPALEVALALLAAQEEELQQA